MAHYVDNATLSYRELHHSTGRDLRAKIHSNDHILETPLDALQPGELAVRDLTSRFDSSRPVIRQ
jgi:hypothetical protein